MRIVLCRLEVASKLEVGQIAPDFAAEPTHGTIHLAELLKESERGVIAYFYPKASTPGCTKGACDLRGSLNPLKGIGYPVIGISAGQMSPPERFADTQSLNSPLVSDSDHEIFESWGAWEEKKDYGRVSIGIIRSTIVINPVGIVMKVLYNVKATGHVARLRRELSIEDWRRRLPLSCAILANCLRKTGSPSGRALSEASRRRRI